MVWGVYNRNFFVHIFRPWRFAGKKHMFNRKCKVILKNKKNKNKNKFPNFVRSISIYAFDYILKK